MGIESATCYRITCDYPGCGRALTVDRNEWHRRGDIEMWLEDGYTYRVPGIIVGGQVVEADGFGNPFHPTAQFRCDEHEGLWDTP